MSAVCESMAYAEKKGLDMDVFMEGAMAGAGRNFLLECYGQRILDDDMAPVVR